MPRQLSSSVSDAVLCAVAAYCCLTMYRDVPKQPFTTSVPANTAASEVDHYDANDTAPLFPSLLTSTLPPSLQLTSLSSLVVYGYFFLTLASAAGTLRFTGQLPSLFVPLHTALTHIATLLTIPSFVLALFPLADSQLTRSAASSLLSHSTTAATSGLPVTSFFTLSLSCLLLFPQLFRHLPRPIALDTSASAISATATVLLLYSAALLSRSTAAGWWLLVGAAPLLLSSVLMAVAPSSEVGLLGGAVRSGAVRVRAVDVFHYSFSATCVIWLHAFRLLMSQQPPVP